MRLFTASAQDLLARCENAGTYATPHARVAPAHPWPAPVGGYKIRHYSLDVPEDPKRFGRIWRSTNFMVNVMYPTQGPRDRTKMSPHHHDDFEQCSLVLGGEYMHHLRWPWTVNMNHWREDEHVRCGTPSMTVIPPPAIHTSAALDAGSNHLVDIFCSPRLDFSAKPGWVLNENEYPLPG